MRTTEKKRKKVQKIIIAVLVLACTVIGGFGIIMAPESDQEELKEELERNEQALRQQEETEKGTAAAIASTDQDSSQNTLQGEGQEGQEGERTQDKRMTVIGDSVFLGAAPAFQKLQEGVVIDAKISRQVFQALDVAKKLEKKGKLGNIVVISLGVNGNFTEATGQELIDYLGKDREIYWVNAHGKDVEWQDNVNKIIDRLAEKNENLQAINWTKLAKKHPDWFYQDGTHLNGKGQEGFAEFIKKEIVRFSKTVVE